MKAVERKLNKTQLAIIWLLVISLLLAAAYVTVILVAGKLASGAGSSTEPPTPLDGEAVYLNQLVAYPMVEETQMTFIEIENEKGKFGVSRYPDDLGYFLFHYYLKDENGEYINEEDEDGNLVPVSIPYTPPIIGAEGEYNYENLYAVEQGDGYGMIPYLTYLCSALGATYFAERIELPAMDTPENIEKRNEMLREYGFSTSNEALATVYFKYGQRDSKGHIIEGSEDDHILLIGDKPLSGTGFYFMVDNRNCVYYTRSEYFTYALAGFEEFIKGMLVAEGLEGESVYGPYLTTDFKKWVTTLYKSESDRVFAYDPNYYEENPTVVVTGNYTTSVEKGLEYVPGENVFSGYESTKNTQFSFDLELLEGDPKSFEIVKNALVGKNVGAYDGVIFTLLTELYGSDAKVLELGEEALRYEYHISKIEAIVTDNGDVTEGAVSETDELLKVTYRYTVGGVSVQHDCHGVINLENLTEADRAKLVGKTVGEELTDITVTIDYTKENALSTKVQYVLTGVNSIFTVDDYGTGAIPAKVITSDTYVSITYYRTVGGVKGEEESSVIKISDIKDDSKFINLKTFLLGKGKGTYSEIFYSSDHYYEVMREFITYDIENIDYFVADEIVVSFRFENASKRDPFYADTFYVNTLENEYKLYGLNAGTCETAVKLLGGVGTDSNSALGLSGETVAIGLTLANMYKYELFAHRVYFEMPRGIWDASEAAGDTNADDLSDFEWLSTLGFNLYISDSKYDELTGERIRYIGSDMYDVIVKVKAEDFDFLEFGFVEFWARRNMIMMDIVNLDSLRVEFNMQDLTGEYKFDVIFEEKYDGYVNGKYYVSSTPFNNCSSFDAQTVRVTASDDAFNTAFKEKFGTSLGDLSSVYNDIWGNGEVTYYPDSRDTLGVAYFNSVYETLQLTTYIDCISEEEQAAALSKPPILSMHFEVSGKEYYYTYDFHRLDDRRVVVSIYKSDENGNKVESLLEVSDFYISTFAFKRIVNQFVCLLNGQEVDESVDYD